MSDFYCHKCAIQLGYLKSIDAEVDFTGSAYSLDKFYRHTVPPTSNKIISVFDTSDYGNYREYIINTAASGSVEIDSRNRLNVVWVAGRPTGFTFINGTAQIPNDSVKVVFHDDEDKIHAYPTGSVGFSTAKCKNCGSDIVY